MEAAVSCHLAVSFHYAFTAGECRNKGSQGYTEWGSAFSPAGEAAISLSRRKIHALQHGLEILHLSLEGMHSPCGAITVSLDGPPLFGTGKIKCDLSMCSQYETDQQMLLKHKVSQLMSMSISKMYFFFKSGI